jgi:hypothetical protein
MDEQLNRRDDRDTHQGQARATRPPEAPADRCPLPADRKRRAQLRALWRLEQALWRRGGCTTQREEGDPEP